MILVLGARGQLGSAVLAQHPDAVGVARSDLDLAVAARSDMHGLVEALRPDVVVNCAAFTAVDAAEAQPELAYRINGTCVGWLAEAAVRNGASFLTFSTDFVFDGRERRPYVESDPTAPINVYGGSKLAGEAAALEVEGPVLVVRTAWLAAAHHPNFVTKVLEKAAAGAPIEVVDDQIGSPTFVPDLAERSIEAISGDEFGLLHLAGSGQTSRYELARAALEAAGLDPDQVKPVSSDRFPTPAARPAYSVLGSARTEIAPLPSWRVSLDEMVAAHLGRK